MIQDPVELVLVMWNSDEEEEVSGLNHDLTTNRGAADVGENCSDLRDMDSPGVGCGDVDGGDTLGVARIARTFCKSVQYPLSVIK